MPFSLRNYDSWKLSTPERNEKVAFNCDHCGLPIFIGEEYVHMEDGDVHEECYEEFAWETLDANRKVAEEEVYYGEND